MDQSIIRLVMLLKTPGFWPFIRAKISIPRASISRCSEPDAPDFPEIWPLIIRPGPFHQEYHRPQEFSTKIRFPPRDAVRVAPQFFPPEHIFTPRATMD